jgi:NAD(P)-dependent dehydrogenase (short-subunit alcohol dehydrogenase family)
VRVFDTLAGRSIVLAGGSGGLGSETARLLGDEGAALVVSYHSSAERARAINGATIVRADLASEADRKALLDAAPRFYGLVVFTGVAARAGSSTDILELMRVSDQVNYIGPVLLAREAAERMIAAGTQGAIVLFSTMQATDLFVGSTAYAGPKAALLHAARILAKECRGPANIRVNVICPGVTQAGMAEASIRSGKYNRYLDEGAIARFGRARDIAKVVRFLLEPDSYITGQVITVDGGLTL